MSAYFCPICRVNGIQLYMRIGLRNSYMMMKFWYDKRIPTEKSFEPSLLIQKHASNILMI